MSPNEFRRKLIAILSADVKGYSRLMGEDEEATVRTITAHREVITIVIRKFRGRVVDSPGDNILAEFASVVDAVQGAVEIQEVIRAKNAELPENRRMEFRIGINLGDVIQEGDRIYGDGVNIAARLEGLAEAGGICISGSAYEQIENKLALGYEYIGKHTVKNIVKPIRVYKVPIRTETVDKVIGEKRAEHRHRQRVGFAAVIALLVVVGGLVLWKFSQHKASIPVKVEKPISSPLKEQQFSRHKASIPLKVEKPISSSLKEQQFSQHKAPIPLEGSSEEEMSPQPAIAMSGKSKAGIVVLHGNGPPTKHIEDLVYKLKSSKFLVSHPEMPWSENRHYDAPVDDAVEQTNWALGELKERGAKKLFLVGHGKGGVFALYFASKYPVDGLIAIAPGGNVGGKKFREKLQGSVEKAKKMISSGEGNQKTTLQDLEGSRGVTNIQAPPAAYFTWFDPDGAMNSKKSAQRINANVPILWIVPRDDYEGLKKVNIPMFDLFPENAKTRFYEPSADHKKAPYEAANEIIKWVSEISNY